MKRNTIAALAATCVALVGLIGVVSVLADPVQPASLQLRCRRTTQASGNVTNITYWQGDAISFTNSYMFTDSAGTATQNLDGCSISVVMGSLSSTNVTTAVGTAISTNDGTWTATCTVPSFNPCYIQVSVSNVNVYTYPLYRISTQSKLQD